MRGSVGSLQTAGFDAYRKLCRAGTTFIGVPPIMAVTMPHDPVRGIMGKLMLMMLPVPASSEEYAAAGS
jgi:hypothetical protein